MQGKKLGPEGGERKRSRLLVELNRESSQQWKGGPEITCRTAGSGTSGTKGKGKQLTKHLRGGSRRKNVYYLYAGSKSMGALVAERKMALSFYL